jgi:hypothetical protein
LHEIARSLPIEATFEIWKIKMRWNFYYL